MRKIAIFGTTPSRMEGPHADGSGWERWTIGPGGKDAHHWERLYEIHGSHRTHSWPEDFKGYLNDLSKVEPPRAVWMLQNPVKAMDWWAWHHKKTAEQAAADVTGPWAAAKVLPREDMEDKYGRMWFSSSISWCLGHALDEHDAAVRAGDEAGQVSDIGCWGIDLESGEEYQSQFAGAKFFTTLARLKGITLHFPKGCGLLRDPAVYPDRYESEFASMIYARMERAGRLLGEMKGEYEGLVAEQHRLEGRIGVLREIATEGSLATAKALEDNLRAVIGKIGETAARLNVLMGENGTIEYFRGRYIMGMRDPG